jgi:hypothetical protein
MVDYLDGAFDRMTAVLQLTDRTGVSHALRGNKT